MCICVVGRVLNMTTEELLIKKEDRSFDLDKTHCEWREYEAKHQLPSCKVWGARIFYEVGPATTDEIGKHTSVPGR